MALDLELRILTFILEINRKLNFVRMTATIFLHSYVMQRNVKKKDIFDYVQLNQKRMIQNKTICQRI